MITRLADHALVARWRLSGFRSSHVQTAHGRIHVLEARGRGEGPPVVVLHGLAAAAHHYGALLSELRRHSRRVIGLDMPGHGHSDLPIAEDDDLPEAMEDMLVHALATVAGGEKVVLAGNSLGGAASVRLANRRPDLVAGVFLIAPGGAAVDDDELRLLVDRFALGSHGDALRFVDDLFHTPHPFRHALAWGTRRQFQRPSVRAIVRAFCRESLLDPADVRSLAMPVEVLWGKADRVLSVEHLRFWTANLPAHARLEIGERIGHVPHMDALPELVRRIASFLLHVDAVQAAESATRPDSRAVPAA